MGLEWKPLITFSCVVALVSVQLPPLTYTRDCSISTTENHNFMEPDAIIEWENFRDEIDVAWNIFRTLKSETMVPYQPVLYTDISGEIGVVVNFEFNVARRINQALEGLGMEILMGTGLGRADFYAHRIIPSRLIPIEVKTKYSLPCDSLYASREEVRCRKVIKQIFTYMIDHYARFGIVTTFDKTFFLRAVGSVIQISPPVNSTQLLSTLTSLLFCNGIWQFVLYGEIVPQPNYRPDPEDPPSPDRDPSNDFLPRSMSRSSSSSRPQTRSQSGITTSAYLGGGAGGNVYQAFIDGEPVALKVVRVKDKMKFSQLLNEVTIYNHLSDIQGIYIPKLL
jgi:hypothetical protein